MIEVINLTKSFGDLQVLKGINLTIEKGEKVVIIGPSGSGKSTFLRCLNCMEDPTSGSVQFNGVDLTDMKVDINVQRQHMGMVFLNPMPKLRRKRKKTRWRFWSASGFQTRQTLIRRCFPAVRNSVLRLCVRSR